MAGEFLPPVVTRLTGELGDLESTITEAKALIASLDGKKIKISIDGPATAGLAAGLGVASDEAGILQRNIADISADLIQQTALLGSIDVAMGAVQRDAADISADLIMQTQLLGEVRDLMIESAAAAGAYSNRVRDAGGATNAAFAGFGRFGVGAGLLTAGNIFTVLHLVLAGFGAQVVADTIGISAFGYAMNSLLGDAVKAASSVQNLTTQYAALDNYQKAAALSIKSFTDGLRTADEGGLLGVFYQGLALVQSELGKGNGIVTQATNAFGDFFGMLKADLGSKAWAEVFSGTSNIIRTDLDSLFKLINAGIQVIPGLFHNLNFLGTGLLDVATGTLHAVAAVTEWNPLLTKTAALAGVAWGAYKLLWVGLGAGPGPIQALVTGVGALGTRMATGLGVAALWAQGVGIGGVAAAGALTLGVGALAAGIGFLTYEAFTNVSATQRQIDQMRVTDGAIGNNVAGYQKMDFWLQKNIDTLNTTGKVSSVTWGNVHAGVTVYSQGAVSVGEFSNALVENQQILGNINSNAAKFGVVLGVTSKQAIAAANATGVDLTHGLSTSSSQFVIDAAKIQGYIQAVKLSHNPLAQLRVDAQQASNANNSLADQVTALKGAFGALLGPYQNVISGNITFRDGLATLKTDMAASGNQVGYWNSAVKASAQQLAIEVSNAAALSSAIKAQTGSTSAAIAPLQALISYLRSTGSNSYITRHEIQLLQDTIDALRSKKINIDVVTNYTTTGTNIPQPVSGTIYHKSTGGYASGTSGAAPGYAIVGEMGPELVRFRGGEQVIPHHQLGAALSGGGSGGDVKIQVMLDGRELHGAMARLTFNDNVKNGNRAPDGRPRGTFAPRPVRG